MCGNQGKPAHGWQPCAGYPLFYCTRTPRIRVRVSEVPRPVLGLGAATPGPRAGARYPYTPSAAGWVRAHDATHARRQAGVLNSLKRRFPARAVFEKLFAKLGDRLATSLRSAEKSDARQKRTPNPAQVAAAFKPPHSSPRGRPLSRRRQSSSRNGWMAQTGAWRRYPPAGSKERRKSSPERRRSAVSKSALHSASARERRRSSSSKASGRRGSSSSTGRRPSNRCPSVRSAQRGAAGC